jgi:hypothetical protein
MTTDLSDPHRALARRHGCRDGHSANSALGRRNDPVWRVGVLRTVRYRRAAARAMVGTLGRLPSSSARTMRRYCHAPAAPPSSRSAISSAPSPPSSSRYTSPTRDESASRYPRSSVLTSSLGVTAPGSRCRSGKDVAYVATASSSTRPSLGFTVITCRGLADGRIPGMPKARWPRHRHRTISRCFMTWIGRNQGCCSALVYVGVSPRGT